MSQFSRRGFVKTMLATAAGATPACGGLRSGVIPEAWGSLSNSASIVIENGGQQLRLSPIGSPLTFQNFLRAGEQWKPSTLPATPLVSGASFSLVPSQMRRNTNAVHCEGNATARGLDGKPLDYVWNAEIQGLAESLAYPWFRFQLTLQLPAPLRLQHGGKSKIEPQIIIWLDSTSTLMEGQSGSWRRVTLSQPTRNSLGTAGNDLPAVYLLDQNAGVETMMYFDMSEMGWMSIENLPRFLVYRCSTISEIGRDGTQRLGVGLIADQATGDVLPAGEVRFTYYLLQRPLNRLLTEQEAVNRWMSALLPLFEERLAWPSCATSWKEYAAATVEDLQQKSVTQVEVNGHTGLRAYVKDTSAIWKQPADNFELMTVADVLWPSLLYLRLHPSPSYEAECKELLSDLPGFYHSATQSISNDFIPPANERADSWYPFENALIKYPTIGMLSGSKDVSEKFLATFQTAEKMARQYNYLFPIYYQVATLRAEGAGTNYAVGGLYAWAAILAHRLTAEERYREEARRAIQVLYTVPSDRLFHEPQELAYGALAAAELGMKDAATYLLYEQLRMFYWYSDPSQKTHDVRGMVQAAASILYPAFKENVEAILPWAGVMKRGIVFEGLLRFMDQQRRNNFYFFQDCAGGSQHSPMAHIPYENLGTLELGGQTGNVGKEIYGAGECLWLYLMFEALGRVEDRELMLVNLDLLDTPAAAQFPAKQLHFVLYNPTLEQRSANISIPAAQGNQVRLSADGKSMANPLNLPAHGIMQLTVEF
jgi:hypothetical protein